MTPDPNPAREIILSAYQAMQRGDRQTARRLAEKAIELAPDSEEPWLLLAGLASPQASVKYLERALRINPKSQRARKGMHWAAERLRQEKAAESFKKHIPTQPIPINKQVSEETEKVPAGKPATSEPKTQPRGSILDEKTAALSAATEAIVPAKATTRRRWLFLTLLLVLVCASAAWAFWPGNAAPVLDLLGIRISLPAIPGIQDIINKPSQTPSFTATDTPTETFTPTSTFTPTPTPTDTATPTETFTLTYTPWPTNTEIPLPTDTEIFLPTDTTEPIIDPGDGMDERWIDVDLTQQMLYAYEGNTVIAAFLVSTGVWQFPTVTGQFNTYVKLESTLMAGDGYYLPNVPYTMYFYKGYGIHGTYWHNNFGTPMSHGCVNMYTPDAEWLFYWAPLGILVNVHY